MFLLLVLGKMFTGLFGVGGAGNQSRARHGNRSSESVIRLRKAEEARGVCRRDRTSALDGATGVQTREDVRGAWEKESRPKRGLLVRWTKKPVFFLRHAVSAKTFRPHVVQENDRNRLVLHAVTTYGVWLFGAVYCRYIFFFTEFAAALSSVLEYQRCRRKVSDPYLQLSMQIQQSNS